MGNQPQIYSAALITEEMPEEGHRNLKLQHLVILFHSTLPEICLCRVSRGDVEIFTASEWVFLLFLPIPFSEAKLRRT